MSMLSGYPFIRVCAFQTDMGESSSAMVEETNQGGSDTKSSNANSHDGVCAICLEEIVPQETALVKGCEHAYWFV